MTSRKSLRQVVMVEFISGRNKAERVNPWNFWIASIDVKALLHLGWSLTSEAGILEKEWLRQKAVACKLEEVGIFCWETCVQAWTQKWGCKQTMVLSQILPWEATPRMWSTQSWALWGKFRGKVWVFFFFNKKILIIKNEYSSEMLLWKIQWFINIEHTTDQYILLSSKEIYWYYYYFAF